MTFIFKKKGFLGIEYVLGYMIFLGIIKRFRFSYTFLMLLFGLAEIITGFIHSFFGLITSQGNTSTYIGVILGACYFVGGLLLLIKKKWAVLVAIFLLIIDIIGRIRMIIMGLYPVNTLFQITGITIGTSIAVFFAFYVGQYFKGFDRSL